MKKLLAFLLIAVPVLAEPTSEVNDPKPQHFVNGIYVGPNTGANGASQGDGTVSATTPLRVLGNASISGTVSVSGDAGISGALSLTGLTVTGDAGVTGNFTVTGGGGYLASSTPEVFWGFQGVTFSNAAKLGGYILPGGTTWGDSAARAATMTSITGMMTTASAGTGAITITVTDGTNTCTYTAACAGAPDAGLASTAVPYRIPGTNGSGTGCVFAPGAQLSASITASNCGTTTPVGGVNFEGKWQ